MTFPVGWSYKREVTVTPGGAAGTADYPYRITLTSANFVFAHANSDGSDLRVTDDEAGSTLLDFWVESWDADSETATIWVKETHPASGTHTNWLWYGNDGASTASSGANTFTDFDDFAGGADQQHLVGSDTANCCTFVPSTRRIYFFGQDKNTGPGVSIVQWLDIDTWEAGFVYPGLSTPVYGAAVQYVESTGRIYIFGGRTIASSALSSAIQYLDVSTHTFGTLAATMPSVISDHEPCLDPTSGKVFLFGGTVASNTRTTAIYSFDPSTETSSTTSAVLPTAVASAGAAYNADDSLIYIVGGVGNGDTSNTDTILSYDPANPNTDPVDTTATIAAPNENQHGAFVDGSLYLFGGYSRSTSTYQSLIQKYVESTNTRTTLVETMPRADDDARAFYDSVTDRIYISAWLHSDQATNNLYYEKIAVLIFNPNDETLATEPTYRTGPPAGWLDEGTGRAPWHQGGKMVLEDDSVTTFSRARRTISPVISSGVWAIEVKAGVPRSGNYVELRGEQGATQISYLRQNSTTNWSIRNAVGTDTTIAAIAADSQVLTTLIDAGAQRQYGLVDRGSRTAAQTLRNNITTGIDRLLINTSSGGEGKLVCDWYLIRKSTTGTEPSAVVGTEDATAAPAPQGEGWVAAVRPRTAIAAVRTRCWIATDRNNQGEGHG